MNTPVDNEGTGGRDSLRHSLGGKAPSQSPERSLVEAYGERQLSGSVLLPSCLTGVGGEEASQPIVPLGSRLCSEPLPFDSPPFSLAPAHQVFSGCSPAPQPPPSFSFLIFFAPVPQLHLSRLFLYLHLLTLSFKGPLPPPRESS